MGMTATDELRRLLDEHGVEWDDMSMRPYACTSWRDPDGEPCTALEFADDIPDGKLSAQALLTPEQAIEATLGRGTCRRVLYKPTGVLVCSECGAGIPKQLDKYCYLHYCPNCGRKVVEQ